MLSLANSSDVNCSRICPIACKFQQNRDQSCRQVHNKLDARHAGIITDIEDILSAKDKDTPALITTKAIERMSDQQAAQLKSSDIFKESAMTMK